MATLERPRDRTLSPDDLLPTFDPLAVPQGPSQLPTRTEWLLQDPDDLISLGEEQLFSGTRTRPTLPPPPASVPLSRHLSSGAATPAMSDALFGSLAAAKQSFLLALTGLLRQHFQGSRWNSLAPLCRHSVDVSASLANPYAALESTPDDALLDALLANLRTHTAQAPASPTPMRSLGNSPLLGNVPSSDRDVLMDELQARVATLALDLPPSDADLARSLGSLLACMERLLSISRVRGLPASSAQPHSPAASGAVGAPPNVYATLEREARALQSWSREADTVVGAAREVETAEKELLWGRVDDLSERVGALCRERARATLVEEREETRSGRERHQTIAEDEKSGEWAAEQSLYETSMDSHDLPRYSTDHTGHHLPPAYAHETEQDFSSDWEKAPVSPELSPSTSTSSPIQRTHRPSTAHNEKMQLDLENVSMAIERLYLVSPQLANQRVDPDRRLVRERQLAKLGNAIERLSKGRLDDQRAIASPHISEEAEEKAVRIKRMQDAALDKLIEQIDRAASRTLADQRVDLNVYRGKHKEVLRNSTQTHRASSSDPQEIKRRAYILQHTGKGRLEAQDAVFSTSVGPDGVPRTPSPGVGAPVTINEFFRSEAAIKDGRPRSNSFPIRPILKNKFSSKGADASLGTGSTSSGSTTPVKKSSTLRLGSFMKGRAPSLSRRGSVEPTGLGLSGSGMSRNGSVGAEGNAVSPLDFIAEESRNLGTIVVTFWPREPVAARDEYEVVGVESDAILVAPTAGGSPSRLSLPSRVVSQAVPVSATGGFYEAKLSTLPTSPTRSRPDLEIRTPLSTAELREVLPSTFACAKCHAELVDSRSITKYNSLPSEHWAELLDAWMCHGDQRLSEDLVAKGKGIKPRLDEGLVGSSYVLFGREVTRNWVTPEHSGLTRTDTDDVLLPAHCATCNVLVGQHVTSLSGSSDTSYVRILKYATYAISSTATTLPRYSLSSHVTAELLEIGQAHACHRFIIEDAETEKARLLLWLFNPAVRVSFSSTSVLADLHLDQRTSPAPFLGRITSILANGPEIRPVSRTMNAVKVFYIVVEDENNPACREFIDSPHSPPERIAYPLAVTERLAGLLRASSAVFPVGKRTWGTMDAGFLERI